jgi:hypothetical protein
MPQPMTQASYPIGFDCVWLAANIRGELCALITAGAGPVPTTLLDCADLNALEGEILRALPRSANPKVLVKVPMPESYRELASRGLFVYDWTDIHKPRIESSGAYELVAIPEPPLLLPSLPRALSSIVVKLPAPSFDRNLLITGPVIGG